MNVTPSSSIPISEIVSCTVPSLLMTTLNVSGVSTSSFIEVGNTIERPLDSPTVAVKS